MKLSLEDRLQYTVEGVLSCDPDRVFIDTCALSLDSWNANTFEPYFKWTKNGYPNQKPSLPRASYEQQRVIRSAQRLIDETSPEFTERIHEEVSFYTSKFVDSYKEFKTTSRRPKEDLMLRAGVLVDQLDLQRKVSSSITPVTPSFVDKERVNRRLTSEEKYRHDVDVDLVASAYLAGEKEKTVIVSRDYDIPYLALHAEKNSREVSDVNLVFVGDEFVIAGGVEDICSYPKVDMRMERKFSNNPVHYSR